MVIINCKTPTPRLKTLNKHNIIHIKYIEMEIVISNLSTGAQDVSLDFHTALEL